MRKGLLPLPVVDAAAVGEGEAVRPLKKAAAGRLHGASIQTAAPYTSPEQKASPKTPRWKRSSPTRRNRAEPERVPKHAFSQYACTSASSSRPPVTRPAKP